MRQTYSDGSVVDWNGSESSDTPSPTIEAVSSLGGGSNSTWSYVALVIAIVALLARARRPPRRKGTRSRVSLRRALAVFSAAGVALAAPAVAHAHAALLKASPSPSVEVNRAPAAVSLTFSEAVEPRFAIVSVTNAAGQQVTSGPPHRSPANPDVLVTPLKQIPPGWYLVYWRVISVDGHPVRGAFTFAVGPNAGPPPQFPVPSLSETAATPQLLVARWLAFLTFMSAIGLFALRMFIGRSVTRVRAGIVAARGVDRILDRARRGADRDAGLPPARDRGVRACDPCGRSARSCR